jgi:small subunit ribosomal protein S8
MSVSDPIADMLTRIRNGQMARKAVVRVPASRVKRAVAQVLRDEGFVGDIAEVSVEGRMELEIALKYFEGRPVIEVLRRVSKPGLRIYRGRDELPRIRGGMGIVILSTSEGVMGDREARSRGRGGEVLAYVA